MPQETISMELKEFTVYKVSSSELQVLRKSSWRGTWAERQIKKWGWEKREEGTPLLKGVAWKSQCLLEKRLRMANFRRCRKLNGENIVKWGGLQHFPQPTLPYPSQASPKKTGCKGRSQTYPSLERRPRQSSPPKLQGVQLSPRPGRQPKGIKLASWTRAVLRILATPPVVQNNLWES